jgi:hypothetical protein
VKRSAVLILSIALLAGACGPADHVEVQALPSLSEASPEARAGLPTITGDWRFAGWELAEGDSASMQRELPRFGVLALATQKRDSVAGQYVIQAGRAPLYGEVRRDSVLALVGVFGSGDLRYLSGRVSRDTFWMEMSSLTEQGNWPTSGRAAFVRTAVAEPFVRLRGALPPVAAVDTAVPVPAAGFPPGAGLPPTAGVAPTPGGALPGAQPAPAPSGAAPPRPRPRPTPRPTPPPSAEPQEPPPPPPVPLLGEPSAQDTTTPGE